MATAGAATGGHGDKSPVLQMVKVREKERERGGGAWCPTAEPCAVSPGRPLRPGPLGWQNCLSIIVSETEGTDPPPESSAPLLASCSLCLP